MWCGFVFAREEVGAMCIRKRPFTACCLPLLFTGRSSLHSYFTHFGFILWLANGFWV
jgi:hypothetical protein